MYSGMPLLQMLKKNVQAGQMDLIKKLSPVSLFLKKISFTCEETGGYSAWIFQLRPWSLSSINQENRSWEQALSWECVRHRSWCCVNCTGHADLGEETSLISNIIRNKLLEAMAKKKALQKAFDSATGRSCVSIQIRAFCNWEHSAQMQELAASVLQPWGILQNLGDREKSTAEATNEHRDGRNRLSVKCAKSFCLGDKTQHCRVRCGTCGIIHGTLRLHC